MRWTLRYVLPSLIGNVGMSWWLLSKLLKYLRIINYTGAGGWNIIMSGCVLYHPVSCSSPLLCNPWLHYPCLASGARAQPSSDADTWRIFSAPGWIFNSPLFLSRKGAEAEKWYLAQQAGIKHWVLRPGLCNVIYLTLNVWMIWLRNSPLKI